jgi:hypothetical protein
VIPLDKSVDETRSFHPFTTRHKELYRNEVCVSRQIYHVCSTGSVKTGVRLLPFYDCRNKFVQHSYSPTAILSSGPSAQSSDFIVISLINFKCQFWSVVRSLMIINWPHSDQAAACWVQMRHLTASVFRNLFSANSKENLNSEFRYIFICKTGQTYP